MRVTPTQGPPNLTPTTNPMNSPTYKAERARAVTVLEGKNPDTANQTPIPVQANAVTPEDMGAIVPRPNIDRVRAAQLETKTDSLPTEPPVTTQENQETAPENRPAKTEQDSELSDRYKLLVRRERQMRERDQKRQQALQAREDALKQKEADLATKAGDDYIPKQRLREQTLQAIAEAKGMTVEQAYEDMVNQLVAQQNPLDPRVSSVITDLQNQVKSLQDKIKTQEVSQTEAQTAQRRAAVRQISSDVSEVIATSPDEYEMIRHTRSSRDVADLIVKTFDEGLLKPNARHDKDWQYPPGTVMPTETAARIIEDYLVNQTLDLSKAKKIQSRLKTQSATGNQSQEKPNTPQPQIMRTLTNASSTAPKLSARQRAILAMEGKLGN